MHFFIVFEGHMVYELIVFEGHMVYAVGEVEILPFAKNYRHLSDMQISNEASSLFLSIFFLECACLKLSI